MLTSSQTQHFERRYGLGLLDAILLLTRGTGEKTSDASIRSVRLEGHHDQCTARQASQIPFTPRYQALTIDPLGAPNLGTVLHLSYQKKPATILGRHCHDWLVTMAPIPCILESDDCDIDRRTTSESP